ncbi:MAG: NADH-quinone oxidoreductase subunit M [Candidatus Sericytochromatia bacterium]
MFNDIILSLLIFFPIVAGITTLLLPGKNKESIKISSLYASFLTFGFSVFMFLNFENTSSFQFLVERTWYAQLGINYKVGVDGISLLLVMITTLFTPLAILGTWNSIKEKHKAFYSALLLAEGFMIGSAVSLDMFLFYVFWELMLLPMFLIVGVWGESKKLAITGKFFVYTMIGSLGMLFSMLYIYQSHFKQFGFYSFDIVDIYKTNIPLEYSSVLFLLFLSAFAIKAPLFPFHTWLPDTYTESPSSGTVMLSAVMAKLGVYGMIRFVIPIFPQTFQQYANILMVLAVIGTIYGALLALVQKDMKRVIAYSSMSHLGYIVLGVFALNVQALQGSVVQMLNHALSTGALFLIAGFIEERVKTRKIENLGGLMNHIPVLGTFFLLALFSSIGLPGLNGFIGEFLIFLGIFGKNPLISAIATSSVIFGAAYMLWLFQRVMFGKSEKEIKFNFKKMRENELVVLIPISILIIVLGVYPKPILNKIEPTIINYIDFVKNKKDSNSVAFSVESLPPIFSLPKEKSNLPQIK